MMDVALDTNLIILFLITMVFLKYRIADDGKFWAAEPLGPGIFWRRRRGLKGSPLHEVGSCSATSILLRQNCPTELGQFQYCPEPQERRQRRRAKSGELSSQKSLPSLTFFNLGLCLPYFLQVVNSNLWLLPDTTLLNFRVSGFVHSEKFLYVRWSVRGTQNTQDYLLIVD